jgi:DNA polymerase elongation subunit (family B)
MNTDQYKAVSMDFASLYPNTMKRFNIRPDNIASIKRHIRKMKYKKLFEDERTISVRCMKRNLTANFDINH